MHKIIFATAPAEEPYKIVLSEGRVEEAEKALEVLQRLPYDGELWLPCYSKLLWGRSEVSGKPMIYVWKDGVTIGCGYVDGFENLLDSKHFKSFAQLPDFYISSDFARLYEEHGSKARRKLSKKDWQLIEGNLPERDQEKSA